MRCFPSIDRSLAATLVIAAAYVNGLITPAAGSQEKPESPKGPGYHTDTETPSGNPLLSSTASRQKLEAQLLTTTLQELRLGQLEQAVASLQRLVTVAPSEPSYKRLLHIARHQLQAESWYRFQERSTPAEVKAPVEAPLDDLIILRLRVATWLSAHDSTPRAGK